VVEGEAGVGSQLAGHVSVGAVEEHETGAPLGLPAVVLDVRTPRQREVERVDHERELSQHEVAFGEAEGVHVGGVADRHRADHVRLLIARADPEEAVAGARPEFGGVVEHRSVGAVEVGVGGGELAGGLEREHVGGVQRVRVELHRHRRLRHGDEALTQVCHVDVRVVGECHAGLEQALDTLEDRAAGIGGELPIGDLTALLCGPVGTPLQVTPAVGHTPTGDREPVQHRQAVEPMTHLARAHLEARGPRAQQRALQPVRQLPLDGQLVDHALLLERGEPERRGALGRCARGGSDGRRGCGRHGSSWAPREE